MLSSLKIQELLLSKTDQKLSLDEKKLLPSPGKDKSQPNWIEIANTPRKFVLHLTKEQCKAAKEEKVIEMQDDAKNPLKIMALGCHGELGKNPESVAALMADIAKNENINLVLVTGDNIYTDGARQPDDFKFETHFHSKFLKYPQLRDKLFVMCEGNHDHGLHDFIGLISMTPDDAKTSIATAANQVAHTYFVPTKNVLGQTEFVFDPEKLKYLQELHIDLETLIEKGFRWFMPSRFFLLDIPEFNTELYILDSNTFLRDYLSLKENLEKLTEIHNKNYKGLLLKIESLKINTELKEEEKTKLKEKLNAQAIELEKKIKELDERIKSYKEEDAPKQVQFFLREYHLNPKRRKMIAQHHPLSSTGSRVKSPDTRHHLKQHELKDLQALLELKDHDMSIQVLIQAIFEQGDIFPSLDLLVHSHDHALSIYNSKYLGESIINEKGFCQLNVGGGGGRLHFRYEFEEIEKSPLYAGHGCAVIELTGTKKELPIIMKIHSTQGRTWHFNNKSIDPIVDLKHIPKSEHQLFHLVRKLIFTGCYEYFRAYSNMRKTQYSIWRYAEGLFFGIYGVEGIRRGIYLLNFLCEPKPISMLRFLSEVQIILKKSTALLAKINEQFAATEFETSIKFKAENLDEFIQQFRSQREFPDSPITPSWVKIDHEDFMSELFQEPYFYGPSPTFPI